MGSGRGRHGGSSWGLAIVMGSNLGRRLLVRVCGSRRLLVGDGAAVLVIGGGGHGHGRHLHVRDGGPVRGGRV
jgi:hypothetical protein